MKNSFKLISSLHIYVLSAVLLCASVVRAEEWDGFVRSSKSSGTRTECHLLLKTANAKGEERDTPESIRAQAASVLLMLIFEHPSLLSAAAQQGLADQDLLTLFHLSGAFALKPIVKYATFLDKDRTRFSKIVKEPRSTKDASGRGREPLLTELRQAPREELVAILMQAMAEQWRIPGKDWASGDFYFKSPVHFSRTLLPTFHRDLNTVQVKVENFKAFHWGEIADIERMARALLPEKKNRDMYGQALFAEDYAKDLEVALKIRALIRDFFVPRAERFLHVRDEVLRFAFTDRGVRDALVVDTVDRSDLRAEILAFARGEITDPSLEDGQRSPTLSLPAPVVAEKIAPETLAEVLNQFSNPESHADPLAATHKALIAADVALASLPSRNNFADLRAKLPPISQFAAGAAQMLKDVNALSQQAEIDLSNLEEIAKVMHLIGEKSATGFANYGNYLMEAGLSDSKINLRLQEAEFAQVALVQSVSSVDLQIEFQIEWKSALGRLQALLRNYRQQQALGTDTSALARQIIDSVMMGEN